MNEITSRTSFRLQELIAVAAACVLSIVLIRIPAFMGEGFDLENFFLRYAFLIGFFGLTTYWMLSGGTIRWKQVVPVGLIFAGMAFYAGFLPSAEDNDSATLAYIHVPLLLWFLFGSVYVGFQWKNSLRGMDYIRFNGDLAVMGALLGLAGMVLSAMSIALFEVTDMHIESFYFENIATSGLVCIPVIGAFILKNKLFPANKVAPLIAHIFAPLVLLTLLIFLVLLPFSGKDLYHDRDFLLIFNFLLLGVMALIVFGLSASNDDSRQKLHRVVLLLLAIATWMIDALALSAIVYRLASFGLTPNRLAVLGSNVLIFIHLSMITVALFRTLLKHKEMESVERTITSYFPVYLVWIAFVVFGFPWIF